MLRRAGGKGVGRTKQALHQLFGVQVRVRLRLGDQSGFTSLVFRGVLGFADAVSKGQQNIAGEELKHLLLVDRAGK